MNQIEDFSFECKGPTVEHFFEYSTENTSVANWTQIPVTLRL